MQVRTSELSIKKIKDLPLDTHQQINRGHRNFKDDPILWEIFLCRRSFAICIAIQSLGEFTPTYILHTRAFGTYLLGELFTLQKRL
jgi:hypothetical protein